MLNAMVLIGEKNMDTCTIKMDLEGIWGLMNGTAAPVLLGNWP